MIGFVDASALVKQYLDEPESDSVEQFLRESRVVVSRLSEVEVASALMRRVRDGSLDAGEYARGLHSLHRDLSDFEIVEVGAEVVALATRLLERHPLRAGDAIQLASCLGLGERTGEQASFLAFDRRLNSAAAGEGLALVSLA